MSARATPARCHSACVSVTKLLPSDGAIYALRRAARADIGAIVALLADDPIATLRDGGDLVPYERAFSVIDADLAQLLIVVEDARGVIVGTLQLTVIPGLARRGAARAQIEAVRVQRDLRGHGLGQALLDWAIEEARRRGCDLVQLTSDKRRPEAHRFYERLGFTASHEGFKLHLGSRPS
jgi:GNAT superfamily N-acetyltransferase